MFLHEFIASLKLLLRKKPLVFWTIAFPLVMGCLFHLAFANIESGEVFDKVSLGVVNDAGFQKEMILKESLKSLSEGDDAIFDITYCTLEEANAALDEGTISGYVQCQEDSVDLFIRKNGIEETITSSVLEEIQADGVIITELSTEKIKAQILKGNFALDFSGLIEEITHDFLETPTHVREVTNPHMSYTMIEFYSLIAMSCLYSSMLSMTLINYKMANLSAVGKRSTVSPASRLAGLTGTLAASFLVQVIGLALLFSLLIFAFLVDFGDHLGHVVLLSLTGSAAGLALGIAVSVLFKVGENMKITILISLTMAGCFFAGMMGIETKYVIDTTVPALNLVNPVAMITDGLYALYYYDTFERFFFDLISIGIFTVIMLAVSLVGLRRQSYDHF